VVDTRIGDNLSDTSSLSSYCFATKSSQFHRLSQIKK
jgi:hypothetical protein